MANVVLASRVQGAVNLKDGKGDKIAFALTPVIAGECRSNTQNIIDKKSTVATFHFGVKHPDKDVIIKDWERIEKLIADSEYDPQEEANGQVFINPETLQMTCTVAPDKSFKYIWKKL